MPDYSKNARLFGFDVLFIVLWVGGWGLLEVLISTLAQDRKRVQVGLYLACFLTAGVISVVATRV